MKSLIAMLVIALALPAGALAAPSDTRLDQREVRSGSLGVPPNLGRAQDTPPQLPRNGMPGTVPGPIPHPRAPHDAPTAEDADWSAAGLTVVAIFAVAAIAAGAAVGLRRHASAQTG